MMAFHHSKDLQDYLVRPKRRPLSRLRAHSKVSVVNEESDDAINRYFHGPGHHGLSTGHKDHRYS